MRIIGRKYRTNSYRSLRDDPIQAVEITQETDKTITIVVRGTQRRVMKRSSSESYWDTYEEARAFLIAQEQHRTKRAHDNLEYRERQLIAATSLPKEERE